MTVKELVERLKKCKMNAEVILQNGDDSTEHQVLTTAFTMKADKFVIVSDMSNKKS